MAFSLGLLSLGSEATIDHPAAQEIAAEYADVVDDVLRVGRTPESKEHPFGVFVEDDRQNDSTANSNINYAVRHRHS
jgi:hypothetical protein